MDSEKINVLVVEPEKKPYMKEISSELSSLQHEVGGYIQAVYPYDEPVAIICDEEAKLKGSELNRVLRDEDGKIYDVIAGTFLVVGLGEEDFSSLTPEHAKQFKEKFDTPEMFMRLNGKLVMIPMEEERVKAKKPSVLQKLNDMKTLDAPSAVKKPHAKERPQPCRIDKPHRISPSANPRLSSASAAGSSLRSVSSAMPRDAQKRRLSSRKRSSA